VYCDSDGLFLNSSYLNYMVMFLKMHNHWRRLYYHIGSNF